MGQGPCPSFGQQVFLLHLLCEQAENNKKLKKNNLKIIFILYNT